MYSDFVWFVRMAGLYNDIYKLDCALSLVHDTKGVKTPVILSPYHSPDPARHLFSDSFACLLILIRSGGKSKPLTL